MPEPTDETQKRFIAILNKKVEPGRLFNVLGHLASGLSAQLSPEDEACFVDYRDADGELHPSLSHYPFIVLRANNSNQIRKARQEAQARGIKFTDFTHTMVEGGSVAQQQITSNTAEAELEYYGICLFGDTLELGEFTKKFSLYK
ncbi:DUF2000 domain-containing protein [Dongshaea marina]|uniref:DUF2000 domain-containing protein n=1 Tax=Dongshaea marina TaxID=2047966 RepID=UPI000D3EC507|nr:DUF2000 domain-containing protein [Dongshaea marina]